MEQIGGISEFKIKSNTHLEVEFPKSIWLQDEIFYYAIPRKRDGHSEILLAPVHPPDWNRVWEIMFYVKTDRPGIIYDLTDLLAKNSINILKQEGLSPSEELQFSFWVLVNLNLYTDLKGLDTKAQDEISLFLMQDLNQQLVDAGLEGISVFGVKEIEMLYENHYKNVSNTINSTQQSQLTSFFHGNQIIFEVKDFKCLIPINKLFSTLEYNATGLKRVHGSIFTDFTQKNFFILRLFEPHQKIVFFDIRYKHTVGAINQLSALIRSVPENKFNIIYNRATIKKDPGVESSTLKESSHWYVLLELEESPEMINPLFKAIESLQKLTFGAGNSIRILDYTDNLKTVLNKEYRRKQYIRAGRLNTVKIALSAIWAVAFLIMGILIAFHHAPVLDVISKSPVLSSMAFLVTVIIGIREFHEGALFLTPKKWRE